MRKRWQFLAVLTLIAWAFYVIYGVGVLRASHSLGAGAMFLLGVALCAMLLLRPSDCGIEVTSMILAGIGFVILNHLLTILREHPLGWTSPAMTMLVGLPVTLLLIPALSVNYWFMKKPHHEPTLTGTILSVLLVQIFPLLGLLVAVALTPVLSSVSASDLPSRLVVLLFSGVVGGCLVAKWELRRRTPSEMRAIFVPSYFRRSSVPDRLCWLAVTACLGVGTALEASRGEWLAWMAQAAGAFALCRLVWWIYRWRFVPPGGIVEQPVSSHVARPSMVRVALLLWALMMVCAILAAVIRRFT